MLAEAGEASKHARKLGRVMGVVAAHRIKDVKEFLAYQQLATWRRENGFDRVEAVEKNWFGDHRSLPPTPEQYYAGLWLEVNALKDAISMPLQLLQLINAIEQDKLSDEEYATLKRCMEKRVRETAQVTAVTRDHTVQHCSPCSPNPDRPSGVHCNLENNEGEMDPRMKEGPKSPSASTGLNTPGQQSPPNEGVWETGRITADSILTAGVDSSKKRKYFVTDGKCGHASQSKEYKNGNGCRNLFDSCYPAKTKAQDIQRRKQAVRPGWKRRAGPALESGCTSTFLFLGRCWEASCLSVWGEAARLLFCFVYALFFFCFPKLLNYPGETYQQAERRGSWTPIKSLMYATGGQALSRLLPYLKMAMTSNARFDRSPNALE